MVLLVVAHVLIWRSSGNLVTLVSESFFILIDLSGVLNDLPSKFRLDYFFLLLGDILLPLTWSVTTFRSPRDLGSWLKF